MRNRLIGIQRENRLVEIHRTSRVLEEDGSLRPGVVEENDVGLLGFREISVGDVIGLLDIVEGLQSPARGVTGGGGTGSLVGRGQCGPCALADVISLEERLRTIGRIHFVAERDQLVRVFDDLCVVLLRTICLVVGGIDVLKKCGVRVLGNEIIEALNLRGGNLVVGASFVGVVLRHRIWLLGPRILAACCGGLGICAGSAAKNKAQG